MKLFYATTHKLSHIVIGIITPCYYERIRLGSLNDMPAFYLEMRYRSFRSKYSFTELTKEIPFLFNEKLIDRSTIEVSIIERALVDYHLQMVETYKSFHFDPCLLPWEQEQGKGRSVALELIRKTNNLIYGDI